MTFVRTLSDELIGKLKNEKLFKECLYPDIQQCIVFPAIRKNEIHFYYKGGRLFKYTTSGFMSHIKYAFVCPDSERNVDIKESSLAKLEHIKSFNDGYNRIKEHCEKYNTGKESEFVSRLFKEYSYINTKSKDDIVILDIEATFPNKNNEDLERTKDKKQNKFDIVLYNKNTHSLRVVEAKLYSNNELHKEKDDQQQNIFEQVERYEKVIKKEKENIVQAYENYLKIINNLFDLNLPTSCTLEDKVGLIYFDFDAPNQNSTKYEDLEKRLTKDLRNNPKYAIGNTSDANNLKTFF